MGKQKEPLNWRMLAVYAGTLIGMFIGAGFATGQEILQFFVAWGDQFPVVVAAATLICMTSMFSYVRLGCRKEIKNNRDLFVHYCGEKLGGIFDLFALGFCFCIYIYMMAAAGSTLQEQFGLPVLVGTLLVGLAVIFSVMLGLNRLIQIIGNLGNLIIILILFVVLWTLFGHMDSVPRNLERVTENYARFGIRRNFAPNAFLAGCAYIGGAVVYTGTFITQMAYRSSCRRTAKTAVVLDVVLFAVSFVLYTLALVSAVGEVGASSIPTLILARKIWEPLGHVYALVVILAIFTTAAPLLWTISGRVYEEHTNKYKGFTAAIGFLGLFVALFVPYKTLIDYVLSIGGYIVIGFWVLLVCHDIREFLEIRKRTSRRSAG